MKDKSLTYFMTSLPRARPLARKSAADVTSRREQGVQYKDDVYSWALKQCALLETGRLDEIDVVNILDEIGDVARREYDKLESALEILLTHMLKWDQQPNRRSRSWRLTIREQRQRAEKQLRQNPGLKSRVAEAIEDGFALGRTGAAREMGVEPESLPAICPYDWDAIMNRVFDERS